METLRELLPIVQEVFDPTDGDSGSAENREDKETCVEEIIDEFNKNEREPIGRLSDLPGAYRPSYNSPNNSP